MAVCVSKLLLFLETKTFFSNTYIDFFRVKKQTTIIIDHSMTSYRLQIDSSQCPSV